MNNPGVAEIPRLHAHGPLHAFRLDLLARNFGHVSTSSLTVTYCGQPM